MLFRTAFLVVMFVSACAQAADGFQRDSVTRIPAYISNSTVDAFQDELERLYELSGYQLIWSDDGEITEQANEAIESIRQAELSGLNSADYDVDWIDRRANNLRHNRFPDIKTLIDFDRALSLSLMRYCSDLHSGRINPLDWGFNVRVKNEQLDPARTVFTFSKSENIQQEILGLEPHFDEYQSLKDYLLRYRGLSVSHPWRPLFRMGDVKPGDNYRDMSRLKSLLVAMGDLADNKDESTSDVYNSDVVEAVKHFQQRHGLVENGVIDWKTYKQLNTPFDKRVEQIELAMERLRWLDAPMQQRRIVVNIPAFELKAYDLKDGIEKPVLKMNVIVGSALEPYKTPVFHANMDYLVFRPYWNVPLGITIKKLIPRILRDPLYLEKHNYEIVESDFSFAHKYEPDASGFYDQEIIDALYTEQLRIRQKPGRYNTLGLLKFIMPNTMNVYLHGTSSKNLFNHSRRDFSHGCIRVEDPARLAEFVLAKQQDPWNASRINEAMHGADNFTVKLDQQIPVHMFYTTALVRDDGNIAFFDDIYQHDERLSALLRKTAR